MTSVAAVKTPNNERGKKPEVEDAEQRRPLAEIFNQLARENQKTAKTLTQVLAAT